MNSTLGKTFFHTLKLTLFIVILGIFGVMFLQNFFYINSEQAFINTKLITLRAPIEGVIHLSDIDVGSFVAKEDVVFEISNPLFGNTNSNSQCQYLKTEIDQLENEIVRDTLNAKMVETDYKRYEKLKAAGAVSAQEFDKIESSLKILKSMINNKKAQFLKLKDRLQETNDQLDLLKQSKVTAPSEGVIWSILKKDGEHVDINDEVLQLIDPQAIWIDAFFNERFAEKLKPGDEILVNPIGSHENFTGKIVFLRGGSGRVTYDSAVEIPPKTIGRRLISARITCDWDKRFGIAEFYGIGRSLRIRRRKEHLPDFIQSFLGWHHDD